MTSSTPSPLEPNSFTKFSKDFAVLENKVSRFSFFDSFNLQKREELVELCLNTLENLQKTNNTNKETVEKVKQLTSKALSKAKGNTLSNFFISLFNDNFKRFEGLVQKINKLIEHDTPAAILKSLKSLYDRQPAKSINLATRILFNEHIFEKMQYFNHRLNEQDGKPLFRYTHKIPLTKEKGNNQKIFKNKALTLEIKNQTNQGRFERIKVQDLSKEEFDALLTKYDDIEVIFPTEELTIEELFQLGIIISDSNSCLNSDYTYSNEGFVKRSNCDWKSLKPTNYTTNPPKEFQLEVIVHGPNRDLPGVFSNQGHASIKITTPKGEIFDIGFFPDPSLDGVGMEFEKGALLSPDPFSFYPKHFMKQSTLSYTLNQKAFEKVIEKIEAIQNSKDKSDDLAYHLILKNCSAFARDIRDTALENGAINNTLQMKKFSLLEKAKIHVAEKVVAFVSLNILTDSNQEPIKLDPNAHTFCHLQSKEIYLPINLLFDRTVSP
jgi:hypothetical protein